MWAFLDILRLWTDHWESIGWVVGWAPVLEVEVVGVVVVGEVPHLQRACMSTRCGTGLARSNGFRAHRCLGKRHSHCFFQSNCVRSCNRWGFPCNCDSKKLCKKKGVLEVVGAGLEGVLGSLPPATKLGTTTENDAEVDLQGGSLGCNFSNRPHTWRSGDQGGFKVLWV